MAAYATAATPQGAVLSAACLVAGSLAKQTVAFHALPLGLWFFWTTTRPYKRLWVFLGTGSVLALVAWLPVITMYGGYFWQSAVMFHALKRTRLWFAFVIIYRYLPSAFMLGAIAAATRAIVTRPLSRVLGDRWLLGFVFTLAVDSLLLVKDGSYGHYALPAVAFGSILIGCFAREMLGISTRLAPATLALFAVVTAFPMFMELRGADWRPFPPTRQPAVNAAVATARADVVLSDGNTTPFVLAAGATPMVADSFALKVMDEANRVDLGPLLSAIREGRVPLVLLDRPIEAHQKLVGTADQLWPRAVLEGLAARYEEVGGVPGLHVYRPRR